MPVERLRRFLDENRIKYVVITHSPAYTASEIARSAHISGRQMAKTVMVKLDGRLAMAVLPASELVDLDLLADAAFAQRAEIAEEWEFADLFPDCEIGGMPPFGNLYGLDVYVADSLAEDDEIAFNAGLYTELVRMAYPDYARLVKPRILRFGAAMR
ncbi:MAG TPA: YbaK/EbsC family protein [Gemmatimonadales bacterium]|nr:YbaK/EbsC family protein [Gemmatimonadales bacterium]